MEIIDNKEDERRKENERRQNSNDKVGKIKNTVNEKKKDVQSTR